MSLMLPQVHIFVLSCSPEMLPAEATSQTHKPVSPTPCLLFSDSHRELELATVLFVGISFVKT